MFCQKCGKEIEKNSEFCNFCGAKTKEEKELRRKEDKHIENRQPNVIETKGGLDKLVKASIIIGALVIAFSVAYYLVIFLPQREKIQIEQQKKEQAFQVDKYNEEKKNEAEDENLEKIKELEAADQLNDCISKAKKDMNTSAAIWSKYENDNCNTKRSDDAEEYCLQIVSTKLKEALNKYDQQEKDCYIKFPQK